MVFRDVLRRRFYHVLGGLSAIYVDDRGDAIAKRKGPGDLHRAIRKVNHGRSKTATAAKADAVFCLLCFLIERALIYHFGRDHGRINVLPVCFINFRQATQGGRHEGVRSRANRRRAQDGLITVKGTGRNVDLVNVSRVLRAVHGSITQERKVRRSIIPRHGAIVGDCHIGFHYVTSWFLCFIFCRLSCFIRVNIAKGGLNGEISGHCGQLARLLAFRSVNRPRHAHANRAPSFYTLHTSWLIFRFCDFSVRCLSRATGLAPFFELGGICKRGG